MNDMSLERKTLGLFNDMTINSQNEANHRGGGGVIETGNCVGIRDLEIQGYLLWNRGFYGLQTVTRIGLQN